MSLSILNTGSITTLPTSASTCLKWKIKKKKRRKKWMKLWRIFFPTNVCFLMWSLKWRCKQINKMTIFFWKKFFCGNAMHTTGVICCTFVLWRLTSDFLILKTFYMSLFGHFSFWAPSCFPEVIRLRYSPESIKKHVKGSYKGIQ